MNPPSRVLCVWLAGLAVILGTGGCTYLGYRLDDALDIADLGITVSTRPQLAVYASGPFVQIGTLGGGKVDGHFIGLGGGRATLWGPHYEKSQGALVWGEEWISYRWREAQIEALPEDLRDDAANFMRVGPVGFLQGPLPAADYFGSCPHYLHLGWVGLVGTPRWLQMADFLLGWTTLDLCFDDGVARGKWFGKSLAGVPPPQPDPALAAPAAAPPPR